MSGIKNIKKVTDYPFLNFYEMEAEKRTGDTMPYYMASRALAVEDLRIHKPEKGPDGVAIFALWGEKQDHVVLIRQYRFPAGGFVYEFPAGLVEQGEDFHEAAARELREETGLIFHPVHCDPMFERPFYMTVGLTDEACSIVFGTCSGVPSTKGLEDSEELEVVLADREEVRRILKEEPMAVSCAYMMMLFLQNSEDPFAFLKEDRI